MTVPQRYRSRLAGGISGAVILAVVAAMAARWVASGPSLVAQAQAAYRKGDWDQAALLARRRLRTQDSDAEALRLLARASVRLNRDESATTIYKDRLGADKMQPEDYFLVGLSLVRLGRNDTALGVWEKGARAAPIIPSCSIISRGWRWGWNASIAQPRQPGGWPGSPSTRRRACFSWAKSSISSRIRGRRSWRSSRVSLAIRPRGCSIPARVLRAAPARCLLELGRPVEAEQRLEKLTAGKERADWSHDPEAAWLLSRAFLQQGRFESAVTALAQAGAYRAGHRLEPEPSPYVGAASCARCHSSISQAHRHTRHAHTFHHGRDLFDLPLPDRPLPDPDKSDATHTLKRDGQTIRVETRADGQVYSTVVNYAFGTTGRYLTLIGRDQDRTYRSLRLSYYHTESGSGWSRTAGDAAGADATENVRGEPIDERDGVVRCLFCHVTQSRDFRDPPPTGGPGPAAADSGIGCERCHGPGGNHRAAVNAGFEDRAIVNVRSAPAATIVAQCAQCHIVASRAEIEHAPDDPKFVRSSAMTLTFSRCYTQSGGGLSCLTCHDPHRDAGHSTAFYDSKCLTCHSGSSAGRAGTIHSATAKQAATTKPAGKSTACPVSPAQNCINCHMRKVSVPDLHNSLTDHYIRVHAGVRAGGRAGNAE